MLLPCLAWSSYIVMWKKQGGVSYQFPTSFLPASWLCSAGFGFFDAGSGSSSMTMCLGWWRVVTSNDELTQRSSEWPQNRGFSPSSYTGTLSTKMWFPKQCFSHIFLEIEHDWTIVSRSFIVSCFPLFQQNFLGIPCVPCRLVGSWLFNGAIWSNLAGSRSCGISHAGDQN